MPDRVRMADYYYVVVPDRPGQGARMLGTLMDAGVNLIAAHAFPAGRRRAQVVFIPSRAASFKTAARKAGWKVVGPKQAFVISGGDRTGALVDHFSKLAKAKVNVTASDAVSAGGGRFGAVIWVKARDAKRAAKALGAS